MVVTHLALVADTTRITGSQLNRVSAALQKQATRDLYPIWNALATVDGFEKLEDVPVGYWPIIVRDDISMPGAAGVHLDDRGQPYALVQYSDSWSLTGSHEMLEMLADPYGNRLIAGSSPKRGQGRVEFLVEVADPPEDPQFAYTVNGMLVSDFLTPHFYDPVTVPGVRYSFGGNIPRPRRVLPGGYLTWHHPTTDHWWQQIWFDTPKPKFRDLGVMTGRAGSLRSAIDARTGTVLQLAQQGPASKEYVAARAANRHTKESTYAIARSWRAHIEELRSGTRIEATWGNGRTNDR